MILLQIVLPTRVSPAASGFHFGSPGPPPQDGLRPQPLSAKLPATAVPWCPASRAAQCCTWPAGTPPVHRLPAGHQGVASADNTINILVLYEHCIPACRQNGAALHLEFSACNDNENRRFQPQKLARLKGKSKAIVPAAQLQRVIPLSAARSGTPQAAKAASATARHCAQRPAFSASCWRETLHLSFLIWQLMCQPQSLPCNAQKCRQLHLEAAPPAEDPCTAP